MLALKNRNRCARTFVPRYSRVVQHQGIYLHLLADTAPAWTQPYGKVPEGAPKFLVTPRWRRRKTVKGLTASLGVWSFPHADAYPVPRAWTTCASPLVSVTAHGISKLSFAW
jgi:hypothetical protein